MGETSKIAGESDATSTALPGRKLAPSKTPRMLTPSEITILRQDLKAALSRPMPRSEPLIKSELAQHSDAPHPEGSMPKIRR